MEYLSFICSFSETHKRIQLQGQLSDFITLKNEISPKYSV